jgi:hypothetical protein
LENPPRRTPRLTDRNHFPLLGTGKLDLRKVKELVEKFAAPQSG